MRIALGLEYDGTAFSGWQSQPGGHTVQDVLETALATMAGQPVRVVCAGRTDAGVHATGQVVHFDVAVSRPITAWVRGVNAHLPATVAVRWARLVSENFHARFSALSRRYRYVLLNRPERPALFAGKVGWCQRPLDVDAMRAAARCLIGEHDFSSFRAAECQAKSPIKLMQRFEIVGRDGFLLFDCQANAFLHHMVRNLVGALVYVGLRRMTPAEFVHLLESRDRRQAPPTFAAAGLYLVGVDYDPVWGLPSGGGIMADSPAPTCRDEPDSGGTFPLPPASTS